MTRPLADVATELAAFGLPLRPAGGETDAHPFIDPDRHGPILALQVPPGQAIAVLAEDGRDPTFGTGPAPAGARMRRLLANLTENGHIGAWHAFQEDDGTTWVHIHFGQVAARRFFRRVNWAARTATTSDARPGHAFL